MAPSITGFVPGERRRSLPVGRLIVLALVVVAAGVILAVVWDELSPGFREHVGFVVLAAALGAIVGASELVSRYRDEPVQAVASNAGLTYLTLNAVVSACAYGLLTNYAVTLVPGLAGDRWMTAIVAGFGAMAVLRSKFFTIRTEKGEDVAIGPDAAVTAFLAAADRGVDRSRASRRLDLVSRRSKEVSNPAVGKEFLEISLAAFQNLSTDEKRKLTDDINALAALPYPEDLKLQAVCYLLLAVTGERNFNDIMTNLVTWSQSAPTEPPPPE